MLSLALKKWVAPRFHTAAVGVTPSLPCRTEEMQDERDGGEGKAPQRTVFAECLPFLRRFAKPSRAGQRRRDRREGQKGKETHVRTSLTADRESDPGSVGGDDDQMISWPTPLLLASDSQDSTATAAPSISSQLVPNPMCGKSDLPHSGVVTSSPMAKRVCFIDPVQEEGWTQATSLVQPVKTSHCFPRRQIELTIKWDETALELPVPSTHYVAGPCEEYETPDEFPQSSGVNREQMEASGPVPQIKEIAPPEGALLLPPLWADQLFRLYPWEGAGRVFDDETLRTFGLADRALEAAFPHMLRCGFSFRPTSERSLTWKVLPTSFSQVGEAGSPRRTSACSARADLGLSDFDYISRYSLPKSDWQYCTGTTCSPSASRVRFLEPDFGYPTRDHNDGAEKAAMTLGQRHAMGEVNGCQGELLHYSRKIIKKRAVVRLDFFSSNEESGDEEYYFDSATATYTEDEEKEVLQGSPLSSPVSEAECATGHLQEGAPARGRTGWEDSGAQQNIPPACSDVDGLPSTAEERSSRRTPFPSSGAGGGANEDRRDHRGAFFSDFLA